MIIVTSVKKVHTTELKELNVFAILQVLYIIYVQLIFSQALLQFACNRQANCKCSYKYHKCKRKQKKLNNFKVEASARLPICHSKQLIHRAIFVKSIGFLFANKYSKDFIFFVFLLLITCFIKHNYMHFGHIYNMHSFQNTMH